MKTKIAALVFASVSASASVAHETLPAAARQQAALAASQPLSAPAPLAARFRIVIDDPKARSRPDQRQQEWYFYRDESRIAVLKGNVEDIWLRDARGHIRFERVLHGDKRVVEYSAGELATLGVAADWNALAGFFDATKLTRMKQTSRTGSGTSQRVHYSAVAGTERVSVEWLTALQLPARIERRSTVKGGRSTRYELLASGEKPLAAWPLPGAGSADYLRIDAADFGDMEYDPIVKKAEAIDVRAGWRAPHAHD